MSDEETRKKVEFIVEQLADLSARQQETDSVVTRFDEAILDKIERIVTVLTALSDTQSKIIDHLSTVADAQLRTDRKLAETDEKLDSLIDVVERHLSEGDGAEPKG